MGFLSKKRKMGLWTVISKGAGTYLQIDDQIRFKHFCLTRQLISLLPERKCIAGPFMEGLKRKKNDRNCMGKCFSVSLCPVQFFAELQPEKKSCISVGLIFRSMIH